jgi:hypothetical protein
MSIQIINLNKLLLLCALPENKLITALKADLNAEREKLIGRKSGGGHFHYPWWEVAKGHVVGDADLGEMLPLLIAGGINRDRLYPLLTEAFLRWLDEFRRSTNLPVNINEEEVHKHYMVPEMGLTVKVDNLLALKLGEDTHRLVYPYFAETPALADEWARVGLWLMREALSEFDFTQMEILDVLRARSFRGSSVFLRGNEEAAFAAKYKRMLGLWKKLRPEYGLQDV